MHRFSSPLVLTDELDPDLHEDADELDADLHDDVVELDADLRFFEIVGILSQQFRKILVEGSP